jgi:hypothetical protein
MTDVQLGYIQDMIKYTAQVAKYNKLMNTIKDK